MDSSEMCFILTHKISETNSPSLLGLNPGFALIEYFNFFYYIGQCPFRFQYSPQIRRYTKHTNVFQQGVCLFMNICVMLNLMSYLRWYTAQGSSPTGGLTNSSELLYFEIGLSFGEAVLGVSFLITTWFYASNMEALVNYYHVYLQCFSIKRSKWNKCAGAIALIVFSVTTLLCEGITLGLNLEETETYLDTDFHYLLFLDLFSYTFESKLGKLVMKIILFLTRLQFYAVYVACQTVLITSAVSMMYTLSAMEKTLPRCSANQGIEYYAKLKKLCTLSNKALNLVVFGGVFGQILAIAFGIPSIIQPESHFAFLENLMHATVETGYLILAALVVTKSTSIFEDWLIKSQKFSTMDERQVAVLLYGLSQQEISVATAGMVKLTPGFLGAVLGLVFTFAIVIIQFKNPDKNKQQFQNCTCTA